MSLPKPASITGSTLRRYPGLQTADTEGGRARHGLERESQQHEEQ